MKRSKKKNMIKYNFYIPEPSLEVLKAESEKTGVTISELIRRAITIWVDVRDRSNRLLARMR